MGGQGRGSQSPGAYQPDPIIMTKVVKQELPPVQGALIMPYRCVVQGIDGQNKKMEWKETRVGNVGINCIRDEPAYVSA